MGIGRPLGYLYGRFFGYDIFISYSRRSSTSYAVSLRKQLNDLGLSCFLDQREIYAGAPTDPVIVAAIERSSAVVPIIAKGTEASAYVPVEIALALKLGKQIVPISVANEVRVATWSAIQRFRWIDETASAVSSGVPADGVAAQIKQNFAALRRAQFRRIALGAIGLTLSTFGSLAYVAHREARIEESFGLYSRGLEAAASKDKHSALLNFAAALERNDSAQIRLALSSVLQGPRWRWDFLVPPGGVAKPGEAGADPSARIAFSGGRDATLFVIRGQRLFALEASSGLPRRICNFSAALTAIAVDGITGSVAVGDAAGRIFMFRNHCLAEPRSLSVDGPVSALNFGSDGSLLGVGVEGGGLRVIDPATGEQWYRSPAGQHEQTVSAIAFAPHSSRMAWSTGRFLYASEPVTSYLRLIGPQNDDIEAVTWDKADDLVAAAGIDGRIQLTNLHQKASGPREILSTRRRQRPDLQELPGHPDGVSAMQLLEADGVLASAGYDGRMRLWDMSQGELSFSVDAYDDGVADLAVSSDAGLIATVSRDGRVRAWDAGTGFGAIAWTNRQLQDTASFAAKSGGNGIDALVDAGSSTLMVGIASGSVTAVENGETRRVVELQQVRPRQDFLRASPDRMRVLSVSPAFSSPSLRGLGNVGLTVLLRTATSWAAAAVKTDLSVVDAAWTNDPGTIAILA